MESGDQVLEQRVHAVNMLLAEHIHFSTQKRANYDKMLTTQEFMSSRKYFDFFLKTFMGVEWLN